MYVYAWKHISLAIIWVGFLLLLPLLFVYEIFRCLLIFGCF